MRSVPLIALVILLATWPVWGCAVAPPPGERVDILREDAVIVWNPATKTEHFIRRAQFGTQAKAFGFLVPTPTRPQLTEAPASVFEEMQKAIEPASVPWVLQPTLLLTALFGHGSSRMPAGASSAAPVQVLEEKRVGGYDAAVLAASDPAALSDWLKQHGFSGADLKDWLVPYVAHGWILTAFKISRGDQEQVTSSGLVRLSFKTDRPFYPYREPPQPTKGEPRLLRVYFVGDARVKANIGENGPAMPGRVDYAAQPATLAAMLDGAVPADQIPPNAWLTSFRDPSSPRPGTDEVWFSTDASQEQVIPAPVIGSKTTRIPVPLDVLGLMLVAGIVFYLRKKRQNA